MYDPPGIDFMDINTGKRCRYVTEGHTAGWVCWKHPDGQWVTLRRPWAEELLKLGVNPGREVTATPAEPDTCWICDRVQTRIGMCEHCFDLGGE